MTVSDLRCDACGRFLPAPSSGVRFVYHPGMAELRDDSGLACGPCWEALTCGLDAAAQVGRCAACEEAAPRQLSLHLRRFDDPATWRLCRRHALAFLNSLRTVQPKLDPDTFRWPAEAGG